METIEGKAKISVPAGVFFNPDMEACRSITSLWAGTIGQKLAVCDAFCASGVRGIRCMLENENIASVAFIDLSKKACSAVRGNIKKNKISGKKSKNAKERTKVKVVNSDIRKLLISGKDTDFDFFEIDPFGTPVPYLADVMRCGDLRKARYVSITATDMAVLCGAHHAACLKNYGARPLNNEFCHENALRILIGRIAREAAHNGFGTNVELSISHRHYVKVFARLEAGAEKATESAKLSNYYVAYCFGCGHRKLGKFPEKKCPECGKNLEWAGPLWGGAWCEKEKVVKIARIYAERKYLQTNELGKLISNLEDECAGPAFYHDLHEVASRSKKQIPKMDEFIQRLRKEGFFASRTHFCPTAIRTDAGIRDIIQLLG